MSPLVHRILDAIGIAAEVLERFGERSPVCIFDAEFFRLKQTGDRPAARESAVVLSFFTGEDNYLDRMVCRNSGFLKGVRAFDAGEASQSAVESAAIGNGVDMGAERNPR